MGLRGVALAAALAFPAAAQAAGSPDVAALQVALHARGAYAGTVDGVLGPATTGAVVRFQARAGLAPDGVAGPRTRHALGRLGRPRLGSRTLRFGAVGADVAGLQFALAWQGSPSGVFDGRFGARLHAAVRRFQRARGLPADGIAGPATLAALRTPASPRVGALTRPAVGPVVSGFGPRERRFHEGVDIAGVAWLHGLGRPGREGRLRRLGRGRLRVHGRRRPRRRRPDALRAPCERDGCARLSCPCRLTPGPDGCNGPRDGAAPALRGARPRARGRSAAAVLGVWENDLATDCC